MVDVIEIAEVKREAVIEKLHKSFSLAVDQDGLNDERWIAFLSDFDRLYRDPDRLMTNEEIERIIGIDKGGVRDNLMYFQQDLEDSCCVLITRELIEAVGDQLLQTARDSGKRKFCIYEVSIGDSRFSYLVRRYIRENKKPEDPDIEYIVDESALTGKPDEIVKVFKCGENGSDLASLKCKVDSVEEYVFVLNGLHIANGAFNSDELADFNRSDSNVSPLGSLGDEKILVFKRKSKVSPIVEQTQYSVVDVMEERKRLIENFRSRFWGASQMRHKNTEDQKIWEDFAEDLAQIYFDYDRLLTLDELKRIAGLDEETISYYRDPEGYVKNVRSLLFYLKDLSPQILCSLPEGYDDWVDLRPERFSYVLITRELIDGVGKHLFDRARESGKKQFVVLEVGAGDSQFPDLIKTYLKRNKGPEDPEVIYIPIDPKTHDTTGRILKMWDRDAIELFHPDEIVSVFMSPGAKLAPLWRKTPSVNEYLAIFDDTCGTQDDLLALANYHNGSIPSYEKDGFEQNELDIPIISYHATERIVAFTRRPQ